MGNQDKGEAATARPKPVETRRKGRLLAAYASVALAVIAALSIIFIFSSGSTSPDLGDSHINVASGSSNGVLPDNRPGIKAPAAVDFNLRDATREARCVLQLHLPDEGHKHIKTTVPEPAYRTMPPTSGNHIDEQQADGAYRETPRPVAVVHSLEHGRLAIQYRSDLPEQVQRELHGLYDAMYGGVLLFPNDLTPYEVTATTWTNILGCPEYRGSDTLKAIRAFGEATWGRYGGEPVNGLDPTAPTPTEPSTP
ncbi:MAG TPA: DUF3105 domain-containing protein [Solirubrobacterales bacterium]